MSLTEPHPVLTIDDPDSLRALVVDFVDGERELTGLDLYYALERTTSLLEFHTMLRAGARNRTREGMQQSYGDHNRMLMLALDRLLVGDAEWLTARIDPEATVDRDGLAECAAAAAALAATVTPDERLALWLGAALHDCGMLYGQGAHVDVEDGVVLARAVLDAICPESVRDVAGFVLYAHDYIKDVFLGEAPAELVAEPLARLDPAQQPLGLAALGLIQIAGAASLGEGRLNEFRLMIFRRCVDGTALADRSTALRLARLVPVSDRSDLDPALDPTLDGLLHATAIHGWHAYARGADAEVRLDSLRALAVANESWRADHILLPPDLSARISTETQADLRVALSGSTVATVRAELR